MIDPNKHVDSTESKEVSITTDAEIYVDSIEKRLNTLSDSFDKRAIQAAMREILPRNYVDIIGDACVGDEVIFPKGIFSGSSRRPSFDGFEVINGKIIKDSYGASKQQHTFTIETQDGDTFRIRGRNLYRYGIYCSNTDREQRNEIVKEKHKRGDQARKDRIERKSMPLNMERGM